MPDLSMPRHQTSTMGESAATIAIVPGRDTATAFLHSAPALKERKRSMMNRSVSRRALVKTLSLTMAAASLRGGQARGAEPQKLDVKDPAAVALGYVESAAQVDVKKYPA